MGLKTNSLFLAAGMAIAVSFQYLFSYLLIQKTKSHFNKLLHSSNEKESDSETEVICLEQLARNYAFLGNHGMDCVRNSFVVVVGLGGVGSHAAHMLIRSGVRRLRIIDFDQITLSSLNRHAVATLQDVGLSKAACLKKHFDQITLGLEIDVVVEIWNLDVADRLLSGSPDFVLDCIDNIPTKVDLIQYCHSKGIKIISSMGAGTKSDPSRIQIADISQTFEDSLARTVRKKLRKFGIENGVPVVYSTEKPGNVALLPLEDEKVVGSNVCDEYALLPSFRARILPVLGPIPAMFGMAMATYVVCNLAKFEISPLSVKNQSQLYRKIFLELKGKGLLKVYEHEIGYSLEEVWNGRSALSNRVDKVTLTRWDAEKDFCLDNLICLTREECEAHEKIPSGQLTSFYGKEFCALVQGKLSAANYQ